MHFLDVGICIDIYLNDSYYNIYNANVIVYFPCMKQEEAQITKTTYAKLQNCKFLVHDLEGT